MPRIDRNAVPVMSGCRYPASHDAPCQDREWLALGVAGGLATLGVNLVTLAPGAWSSQRHWHAREDELVYVLEGELTRVENDGESMLGPGDCAAFPAGVRNGHHLQNRTGEKAVFLAIGGRDGADWGEYSDIDMKFGEGRYSKDGVYLHKDGRPYGKKDG
ncbi:MAG: cupin domain-containing protein [Rhodothalassiaceae bacterium]